MLFVDRPDAGVRLARALGDERAHDPVVLALARSGVRVAAEVARALGARLDVVVVREVGLPLQPDVTVGAVAEDGVAATLAAGSAAPLEEAERREAVVVLETLPWLHTVDEVYLRLDPAGDLAADEGIATLMGHPVIAGPAGAGAAVVTVHADGLVAAPVVVPREPRALVVLARGANSSRHTARHHAIAQVLHGAGFATATVDLLTAREDVRREHVGDVPVLAARLARISRAVRDQPSTRSLPVAWCVTGTAAAAALWAAADGAEVDAVVSQGGRPDLAASRLPEVQVPTLLLVGDRDEVLLDLNRSAQQLLGGRAAIVVVPALGHLVVRAAAATEIAALVDRWLTAQLPVPHTAS